MSLLINKDGKQLGPLSLDEARALVLSGQLTARDWAWPDGATDWVHLKDVPGFTATTPTQPAAPRAQPTVASVPAPAAVEEELWRGHPSQVLNFSIYFFWAIILLVALIVAVAFGDTHLWSIALFGIVALLAIIQISVAYIHLHAIEYVVTTQRVRVVSGIFSKDIQEIELFRVKDTMAHQAFFLRLFGLGTITILSGDQQHPRIVLSGVPNAIELREKLRQEVMTLRQRFGVRELDVM
jgi:membrane protein YdbS with pleckstrin-like domain